MEQLIPLVNQLQDLVYNTIGSDFLDLPSIVVVGSQSCGKSSVLENIVGKDFLPRGTGIVTRRPLILQLINLKRKTKNNHDEESTSDNNSEETSAAGETGSLEGIEEDSDEIEDYAEFLHIPDTKFTDMNKVRAEIENETLRVAGANKGINKLPINLKIYSTRVLNLTLIDLPGLTKIPVGDQPTDIEAQTRSLIMEYISRPNSIILAVSPANFDIVNSEGLKLARSVDPKGKRTIGVLTKLDLMDQGTNAMDILSGRVYPLKLGFVATVNRSQSDIVSHKSMRDALQSERSFFEHHPAYRTIKDRCGTPYLAKTLSNLLVSHIRERLPDIKARLSTLISQTQQQLNNYGDFKLSDQSQRGIILLQAMNRFANTFIASIDGNSSNIPTKELSGGARLYSIFNNVFTTALNSIDPLQNLSTVDIRTAILNSTGSRATLFLSEMAFDILVKPQLNLLAAPCHQCVELVYEELMKICHYSGDSDISHFPKLQTALVETVSDLLRENLTPTYSFVESLIAIQSAYINTNHPDFLGVQGAMAVVLSRKEQNRLMLSQENDEPISSALDTVKPDGIELYSSDPDTSVKSITNKATNEITTLKSDDSAKMQPLDVLASKRYNNAFSTETAERKTFLSYVFGANNATRKAMSIDKSSSYPLNDSLSGGDTNHKNNHPLKMTDLSNEVETMALEDMSEREEVEVDLIKELITSYFNLTRKIIIDQVPKVIMHLLVNASKDAIQNRLVSKLYREDFFDTLLIEDENVKSEREKCERLLSVYNQANKIISTVF
ncbi:mitochondrial dynamin family scission GTPase Dnm1 [Schizosaccharomyces pombe]|uniref:Dynamin-related protein dnm1 n=1 Tax=Schizosaccharomyces pombe (strain 972 / ATCC 24843) TaxID=284812 RepID=DNM1_SCHPO|nr:dynamin Dnm1 [Schizosaccharomyces pombe]Q09748.1 RecName: Full=Dynamin-related protein dnm1 [Schizosaccharomyces pombe 972h-]CAA90821.1 dynamin Dnm1 [Schizosaccharomyces pombe]|eukprot:NP_596014.1 dynamin Dnm1 [Schizosaccharomyces pombe]